MTSSATSGPDAAPLASPECTKTPANVWRVPIPSVAANAPPADMPAAKIRPGCARNARRTARTCASTIATSPSPALVRVSNQFQQRHGLALSFWRGSNTSQPFRSANAAMRVPVAISSGVCLQPCSSTIIGRRFQRE